MDLCVIGSMQKHRTHTAIEAHWRAIGQLSPLCIGLFIMPRMPIERDLFIRKRRLPGFWQLAPKNVENLSSGAEMTSQAQDTGSQHGGNGIVLAGGLRRP